MNRPGRAATAATALCLAYAVSRYILYSDVPWSQAPLFVANKAVAWAGLTLFVLAGWARSGDRRSAWGRAGCALTLLHVVGSCALLGPVYFPKFFTVDGRYTWQAGASMSAGALGALVLLQLTLLSLERRLVEGTTVVKPSERSSREPLAPGLGRWLLALGAVHVLLMGYPGWLTPGKWPGGLPPITLLSFLTALLGLVWGCFRRR